MEVENSFNNYPSKEKSQYHNYRNDDRRNRTENGMTQQRIYAENMKPHFNEIGKRNSYRLNSNVGKHNFQNINSDFAADAASGSSADITDNGNNFWSQKLVKDNYTYARNYESILLPSNETTATSTSSNFFDSTNTFENKSFDTGSGKYFAGPSRIKSVNATESFDESGDTVESLKLKLQIKETQNECLENEIQKFKTMFNQGLSYKQSEFKYERQNSHALCRPIEVPHNLELIFKNLSNTLHNREEELLETKQTLETVLTALALDPSNSVTKYGRYDAENISHKMVVRLETLTNENREMSKMLAYGRSKEVQIELQLARKEISELKTKISELHQALKSHNHDIISAPNAV